MHSFIHLQSALNCHRLPSAPWATETLLQARSKLAAMQPLQQHSICSSTASTRYVQRLVAFTSVRATRDRVRCDAQLSKRQLAAATAVTLGLSLLSSPVEAAGFKKELKKRKIAAEEYSVSEYNGLKFYDLEAGRAGPAIKAGDTVVVHFDVMYRGIDVQSSRNSRTLGGNRTVAEPFSFVAGEPVNAVAVRKITDSANALFSGQGGPKPPAALSQSVIGMKTGGKRSVIVEDVSLGYGPNKGIGEMPPGETFELKIEVLDVLPKK